jgi:BirA family biotin operon repressor/biotin-[acetyl-CoA-carboxylase] ligase
LEILYYNELDSTQDYLTKSIKDKSLKPPIAIVAQHQSAGRGSRGNQWLSSDGNLYLSFAIDMSYLPSDLKIESISIYFAIIMKKALKKFGSKTYIKWPNDFYLDNNKIGGIITSKTSNTIICGIGLNTSSSPVEFGSIDIDVDINTILDSFFDILSQSMTWQEAMIEYKDDFAKSKDLTATIDNKKVSLKDAKLNQDGSININNSNIYSLR